VITRRAGAAWLLPLVTLAVVLSIVLSHAEIGRLVQVLRRVQAGWILAALGLQAVTYVLAAAIWHLALVRQGARQPFLVLVRLALAMLLGNQALPSVGVSGGLFVQEALARRGTPRPAAMAALLLGLTTTCAAFVISLAAALVWLHRHGGTSAFAMSIAVAFAGFAGTVIAGVVAAHRLPHAWHRRLGRWPVVGAAIVAAAQAPPRVLQAPSLLVPLTGLQAIQILVDGATLAVCLRAIGVASGLGTAFSSYVVASAGSRVAFVPLGLGTFEGAAVLMLHGRGVPLEAALAATLVFRGLTLWLPLLPGVWSARRTLA